MPHSFAEVAVNAAVHGPSHSYHYSLPDDLRGLIQPGQLVVVPFGARTAQALVLALSDSAPLAETRAVLRVVDPEPALNSAQIELARWISDTYLAPLIDCLKLMLPPGLAKRAGVSYALAPGRDLAAEKLSPGQRALVEVLQARGPLRARQLERALPDVSWRAAADSLAKRGLVTRADVLEEPSVRAKQVRTARLCVSHSEVQAARGQLSRSPAKAARLAAALDFLADEFEPVEVSWIYAATQTDLQDLKELAARGLVELGEAEVWRDSLAGKEFALAEAPELTADQARAWEVVRAALEARDPTPLLLHGVTGSGKTEIYLRALEATLARGQRGLVLVPEIALTPQTVRRFAARFPGRLAVWHSELGEGERYDTWRRARQGLVDVVIGARSALFAPLPNLGLIVLDEEHDEAYKQDPAFSVSYHAREAGVAYARQLGAVCLLGSATPDLTSYQRARQGVFRLVELPRRVMGHARQLQAQAEQHQVRSRFQSIVGGPAAAQMMDLPPVEVVDLRQELRAGNTSLFSRRLQAALTEVLARNEQAILFLNRRGAATFVFCRDCGEALKCPRCDLPLTQHGAAGELICHYCNHRQPTPARCPACGSARIRFFGAGTQKLEAAVHELFPAARTLRWDRDVTRFKGAHDLILQQFASRQADLLIGTQMVAKGLDLPLVTLVGVLAAEVGLGLPDYRAAERTFQVLTQVAGRAGRSLLGGRVILQTYQPEHYAIQAAAGHDYAAFFQRELRYRKELGYPPFRRLARLLYRQADNQRAEAEAGALAATLRAALRGENPRLSEVVGPTPCFFSKLDDVYRWQVLVRGPDPAAVLRGRVPPGWLVEIDPLSTL